MTEVGKEESVESIAYPYGSGNDGNGAGIAFGQDCSSPKVSVSRLLNETRFKLKKMSQRMVAWLMPVNRVGPSGRYSRAL